MTIDEIEAEMVEYYMRLAPRYETKKGVGVPFPADVEDFWAGLLEQFRPLLEGRNVLEIACGPGTWTHRIAPLVNSIMATDINETTLIEARKKSYPEGKVRFAVASSYTLDGVDGHFDAGFAKDWCSHVPRHKMANFLKAFHSKLRPGARVVMADNWFPTTERPKFSHVDEQGNVIVFRRIPDSDGRKWHVIKNCPYEQDWLDYLADDATDVKYQVYTKNGRSDWIVSYTLK